MLYFHGVMTMFKKLSKKILLSLLATTIFGAILTGLVSYLFSSYVIQSEFKSLASNYFLMSSDNLNQYLSYVEETLEIIASDTTIRSAVHSNGFISGIPDLIDTMNYGLNLRAEAITLYSFLGHTYASTNNTNIISLAELRDNDTVAQFLNNPNEMNMWMSRFNQHPSSDLLRNNSGVFSLFLKMLDESGMPVALISVDLKLNKLSSFFKTENTLFKNTDIFLLHNEQQVTPLIRQIEAPFLDDTDLDTIEQSSFGWLNSNDGKKIVVFGNIDKTAEKLLLFIPISNTLKTLTTLRVVLIVCISLSIIISILLFWKLKNSIVRPLTTLFMRMRTFNSNNHTP